MFDRLDFLNNAINVARLIIASKVKPGDTVVDATMGNGKDTIFLAEMVGEEGKVFAFDIQKEALAKTADLLGTSEIKARVDIIKDSHEKMPEYINRQINCVLFNLGYLPGGDKTITTQAETTAKAIENILPHIAQYGVILLVVYQGHDEGKRERLLVEKVANRLDSKEYNSFIFEPLNQAHNPPILIGIEKR